MSQSENPSYIVITQAFLRFYVVATQYLDHRLGTAPSDFLSQDEVACHLKQSRDTLLELVAANKIVPGKVEKEYEEISRVDTEKAAITELRMVLLNKTSALSDLLAVLRLIPQSK